VQTPMGAYELEFMQFAVQYGRNFESKEEYDARY
jgi:hypothetical protein